MQGQALSYNNFFWQTSLIISPLILSAIYDLSKKWIYYFSSFTALVGVIIMGYIATWDNVKDIGRTATYKVDEPKEIEMQTNEKKDEVKIDLPNDVSLSPQGDQKPVEMSAWGVCHKQSIAVRRACKGRQGTWNSKARDRSRVEGTERRCTRACTRRRSTPEHTPSLCTRRTGAARRATPPCSSNRTRAASTCTHQTACEGTPW